jgi:hypothetical protein
MPQIPSCPRSNVSYPVHPGSDQLYHREKVRSISHPKMPPKLLLTTYMYSLLENDRSRNIYTETPTLALLDS